MGVALCGGVHTTPPLARAVLALAVALGVSSADAAPLFRKRAAGASSRAALKGVDRVARLAVDRGALAALRRAETAALADFPVGPERVAAVDLRRTRPFPPGAVVEEVSATGVRRIPIRPRAYFTGRIRGEPDSRVLVVAGERHVEGFVISGGETYPFGPDGAGGHRAYAMRDVALGEYPPPRQLCANDLHPDVVEGPARAARALRELGVAPPPRLLAADTLLTAQVAVVTDYELFQKFGTPEGTTDYVGTLVAAANTIYERDVSVTLSVPKVRVYTTSIDPWVESDTELALYEVQDEWTNLAPFFGAGVDLVHFVSGKDANGGIAYLNAACDDQSFFGLSQVYGGFDLSNPSSVWDVIVFTHEIGHNLGSPHTHCYSPPVDKCYAAEPGCYSGAPERSRGTIMSYCHLDVGVSNIDLEFGTRVSDRIREFVATASCLTADGGGGGPSGGGGGGGGTARCGDGSLQPGEACDDGNQTDGDGCSASCEIEPGCGDGVLGADEACDDGNTASGDGCSADCVQEPCTVKTQPQALWGEARLDLRPGKRFSLRAQFQPAAGVASANLTGVRLRVDGQDGTPLIDATLPAGRWAVKGRRATFRDAGTLYGIRKVTLRDRTRGGVPEVQVVVSARGSVPAVPERALPLVLTVVLGDQAAGNAGACGRHAFGTGACDSLQRGRRILCR